MWSNKNYLSNGLVFRDTLKIIWDPLSYHSFIFYIHVFLKNHPRYI